MGKHQFRLEAEVVQNKLPSSEHKKLAKIANAQVRDNALLLTYIYIYTLQLAAAWKPSLFQDEKKHKYILPFDAIGVSSDIQHLAAFHSCCQSMIIINPFV